MKRFSFLFLIPFLLLGCTVPESPISTTPKEKTDQTTPTIPQLCVDNGGTYLAQYHECEYGMDATTCESLGGEFNECASACRHDDKAMMCTMQCVVTCTFDPSLIADDGANLPEIMTPSTPSNATYIIDGTPITLVKSRAETELVPGSASGIAKTFLFAQSVADYDGDGEDETGVVMKHETGGTGTFYYASVWDDGKTSETVLIGDRILTMGGVNFEDGKMFVKYKTRYPWQSFSEEPMVEKTKHLQYVDGHLLTVDGAPILLDEEAQELAENAWGSCDGEQCESLTVTVLDGVDGVSYVEALYDGLADDSLRARKHIAQASFIDNQWILGNPIVFEFACREGRGHQEFSTERCE